MDRRTLAAPIGFDSSTIGTVLDRLAERGIVGRSASPTDRRVESGGPERARARSADASQ